jgi:hypothetical protein
MPGGRMTKRELELQSWCEESGVVYRVMRTANDVRDAYHRHILKLRLGNIPPVTGELTTARIVYRQSEQYIHEENK